MAKDIVGAGVAEDALSHTRHRRTVPLHAANADSSRCRRNSAAVRRRTFPFPARSWFNAETDVRNRSSGAMAMTHSPRGYRIMP